MKVTFTIEYKTRWGESLWLVANDKKYPMDWTEDGIWRLILPNMAASDLEDYTYVVMTEGFIWRTEWKHHCFKAEKGVKEIFLKDSWYDCPIQGCLFPRRHQNPRFDIPNFRGAGTAVPIFALRSAEDFGIGEFRDLRPLVDWAAATGQCIIQTLPVNDTTRKGGWDDSYPYSPVSSFALNPMYIHLQDIGVPEDDYFRRKQKALNALPEIDYPVVFRAKTRLMKMAFQKNGSKDIDTPEFRRFCKNNKFWLEEYARFSANRDSDSPEYHKWVQFHLDRQLKEEVAYARSKGVSLKGDLPIGVSADSADAFFHPDLFNLDSHAGAPPDFFSSEGQNWGFPTYNWDRMEKDGYAWWKARLRKMAEFFDAFRIDHILGFFRIWEIPAQYSGGAMGHFNPAIPFKEAEIKAAALPLKGLFLEDPHHKGCYHPMITPDTSNLEPWQKERFDEMYVDFFYHRHENFWRINAERKLPELLSATGMLACGEDLGMVPDCVPGVMEHERILSLEMPQMEKGRTWPYLSVCTTSSHDLETLRMQASEDRTEDECKELLRRSLNSVPMLAIFPIQDWLSMNGTLRRADRDAERINYPADPHNHWKYRLHVDIEKMTADAEFTDQVKKLISESGRSL